MPEIEVKEKTPSFPKELLKPLKSGKYIVFDLETTGGNPEHNRITEISGLKVRNGEVVDSFYTLVNPEIPVPPIVRRMTGLSNQMLKDAPLIEEVLPSFLNFISHDVLVSHNTIGDIKFIRYFAKEILGRQVDNFFLCTHLLAEKVVPEAPDKSLQGLTSFFHVNDGERFHSAEGDARATLAIFKKIVEKLSSTTTKNIVDAIRLQNDFESAVRLGWALSPERLKHLPKGPGVFFLYDQNKKLIFLSGAQNIAREVEKIGKKKNLPNNLLKQVLKTYTIKYETLPNVFETLIREEEEFTKQQPFFSPVLWHNRVYHAICLGEAKGGGTKVSIDYVSKGTKYAFGPVQSFRKWKDFLRNIQQAVDGRWSKNSLILPPHLEDVLKAFFRGELAKEQKKIKPKQALKIFIFNKQKKKELMEKVDLLKFLATQTLPNQVIDCLNLSGLIIVPDSSPGGWQFHYICHSKPQSVDIIKGDWLKELKKSRIIRKYTKKHSPSIAPLTKQEAFQVNAILWWIFDYLVKKRKTEEAWFFSAEDLRNNKQEATFVKISLS